MALQCSHHAHAPAVKARPVRSRLEVRAVLTPVPPSSQGNKDQQVNKPAVFVDPKGTKIKVMPCDFGMRSGNRRVFGDNHGDVPTSVWQLASENFKHELEQMRTSFRYNLYYQQFMRSNPPKTALQKFNVAVGGAVSSALGKLDASLESAGVLPKLDAPPEMSSSQVQQLEAIRAQLDALQLSNEAVAERERARVAVQGDLDTPLLVKLPFMSLCWVLDVVYDNRPIQKFWVLETVARIPYFAYISCLHFYESLRFWRAAELRKIHFAEEWNELHHLQIMESLGGDLAWFDRFVAGHAAVAYYWMLIGFYLVSPKVAYNFMQRVELHAADTYTEFVEANRAQLAEIPPPEVAVKYYRNSDLYLFDEFQTGRKKDGLAPRRPPCNTLLDVFTNIRDDELEHVKTMVACQEQTVSQHLLSNGGHSENEGHNGSGHNGDGRV